MKFRNPTNGVTVSCDNAGLWVFLFGPLYFAHKGAWGPALLDLLLCVFTSGLFAFFAPFFVDSWLRNDFEHRQWVEVDDGETAASGGVWILSPFMAAAFVVLFAWGFSLRLPGLEFIGGGGCVLFVTIAAIGWYNARQEKQGAREATERKAAAVAAAAARQRQAAALDALAAARDKRAAERTEEPAVYRLD